MYCETMLQLQYFMLLGKCPVIAQSTKLTVIQYNITRKPDKMTATIRCTSGDSNAILYTECKDDGQWSGSVTEICEFHSNTQTNTGNNRCIIIVIWYEQIILFLINR